MRSGLIKTRRQWNTLCLLGALACGCAPVASSAEPQFGQNLAALPVASGVQSTSTVATSAVRLTLAELTDLALSNSPATREVWNAAQAQAAALGVAEAANYPTIDGTIALSRGMSSINTSSGVVSGSTQTRLSPSINLNYVLYDFGARSSTIQAARENLLAATLTQNRTLQDVVLRVEQAYYQLLAARQTIVAAEETLKTAQLSFDVANERRHAGLATIGDVYQAETALAQSRLLLRKTQGETSKFKGTLCNAVGLPVYAKLELMPAEERLPLNEVRLSIEQYLSQAKASRPDLAAAEALARGAHASSEAASGQDKPSLELAMSGGKTYNNFPDNSFNNGSGNATVGINLRIPLFGGFRSSNTILQLQSRAEQLEATRDRIALQIELEVWQAYFDLDTAVAAIDSARSLLKSASQSREVAQARYQAGVGNLLNLLSAQTSEANARMEIIQAEMSWYSSLSRLNNAIGQFSYAGYK
jgi:outer membrane protein TolC